MLLLVNLPWLFQAGPRGHLLSARFFYDDAMLLLVNLVWLFQAGLSRPFHGLGASLFSARSLMTLQCCYWSILRGCSRRGFLDPFMGLGPFTLCSFSYDDVAMLLLVNPSWLFQAGLLSTLSWAWGHLFSARSLTTLHCCYWSIFRGCSRQVSRDSFMGVRFFSRGGLALVRLHHHGVPAVLLFLRLQFLGASRKFESVFVGI